MRALAAVTSAFVLLAVVLALPSCSDDPSATTTTDAGPGTGDGGVPEAAPPPIDAAPDGSSSSGEYRGGTRLRPIVTTGGGAKLFSRFHDKMLDVDCTFTTLADGARYCAPTAPRPGTVYFTDDQCTQKIVAWDATCAPAAPAKYAQYTDYELGCTAPEVLELGVGSAPATTYEKQGANCVAHVGPTLTYRAVTRTVAPAELVKATVTREPRGKQLSAAYLDGADGSRQPLGIEDGAPHAGPCEEATMGDGARRCLPSLVAFLENAYSDAACTTDAAYKPGYVSDSCKLAPVAVLASVKAMCLPNAPALFDVGAKLPGPFFQGPPASCMPFAAAPALGASYYAKGAPIADTAFASLKHVHGAGAPLGLESIAVDTGELVQTSSFWDPARAATCSAGKTSDGKTRCVGRTADTLVFADVGCTQPLATVNQVPGGCTAPAPPTHVWFDAPAAGSCGGASTLRAWKVGAKVSPAQVFSGSGCSPGAPFPSVDYYATTTEVAASDLVELTEVTE